MNAKPYLNFDGRTEEALAFYTKAVGAKIGRVLRMKDAPPDGQTGFDKMPPGTADKVMHSTFSIGDSQLMAADGYCQGKAKFEGFSLTLEVPDEAAARRSFAALSEGGKVQMPLGKTFFSDCFGMVQDKFGLGWMVIVYKPGAA
jgi:PhnB protein